MFVHKKRKRQTTKKYIGMTIVEGVILLGIFSIVTAALYETIVLGMQHIARSKDKLVAIGIANERMEILRSLDYAVLATVGGTPSGLLDPDEYVVVSGRSYHVLTSIVYVDDPDDGTAAASTDSEPNDYKEAHIRVLWGAESDTETVSVKSRFVPGGLETDSGGGVISVNVIDSEGIAVANANVRIENSTTSPAVDTTIATGTNGNSMLVGAEAATQSYEITVTKTGYDMSETLPPYPTTSYYPDNVHLTVNNDAFTTTVLVISPLSDISFQIRDPLNNPVADVDFDLEGGKKLGDDGGSVDTYNYDSSLTGNSGGIIDVADVSPGPYTFTLTESGYTFWKVDYSSNNDANEILLPQNGTLGVDAIIMDDTQPSFFVEILDNDTGTLVEGADVRLENTTDSYDVEEETDLYGYAYIPTDTADAPTDGQTYDITVTHDDYVTETDTVTISGLTTGTIYITPN
jgi:type II secretory pathway pseudopilin PulG